MSCLDATFTLTPRAPFYWTAPQNQAELFCNGADFSYTGATRFSSLYTTDRFFFDAAFASDPTLDYSQWANRKNARFLTAFIDVRDYGAQKELALIFAFDVASTLGGRVLVYSDSGLIQNQLLADGDHQFMIELESVSQSMVLYFIHAGGYWFFKGLSGYVV